MSSKNLKLNKGFTLTELLVVLSIATIMMTALVIQQNKWNDNLSVSTQAYELALMIRQAQFYALGVREYQTTANIDKFNVAYGVDFDIDTPDRYIFFVDKNRDGKCGNPSITLCKDSDEILDTKILSRGVTFQKICAFLPPMEKCSTNSALNEIPLTFFRPLPKANAQYLNSSGGTVGSLMPPTIIYLVSSGGQRFYVQIEENGQVSIGRNAPP